MAGSSPDLEHPAFRPLEVQQGSHGRSRGLVLVCRLGISEPAFVPAALLPIVGLFDGQRSVAAICAEAGAALGEVVEEAFVRDLVRQFDRRLLLHSDAWQRAVAARQQAFLGQRVRPPRHAGSAGYPAEPSALRAALREVVPLAPGTGPAARGVVAPHIDLARGRAGYAAAYGFLGAAAPADLYVIFGTGHQGPAAPLTGLAMDWATPLGTVTTDRAFLARVEATIGPAAADDAFLHEAEHSIEFQVLWLQHLAELRGGAPFEVVGFLCGSLPSESGDPDQERYADRLLTALRAAATASGRRVCYVGGADLAHLGPFFGDGQPVDDARLARLQRDEQGHLDLLVQGRPGRFHQAIHGHGNPDRVCSAPAIWLTARLAGGPGRLLHHGQAAAADGSQVVSFCGLGWGGDASQP